MRILFYRLVCVLLALAMLLSVVLLTGCGKEENGKTVVTTPLLRIGILSDIHLNADVRHNMYDRFEKALMFYKEKGVDGILITGDLQDNRTSVATAISAMGICPFFEVFLPYRLGRILCVSTL